jgi:Transposase IS66 family
MKKREEPSQMTMAEMTDLVLKLTEEIKQLKARACSCKTEELNDLVLKLTEENEQLKQELAAASKKVSIKPNIEPSKLEDKKKQKKGSKQRPKKHKKARKLTPTEEVIVEAPKDKLPEGSVFLKHKPYFVQELEIKTKVIKYKLEVWKTPSGERVKAELPQEVKGSHFGPVLKQYIVNQLNNNRVTQKRLYEDLKAKGILISTGTINAINEAVAESLKAEKDALLHVGLRNCEEVRTDDTGARHKGKNGFCTVIQNDLFSFFQSSDNKTRVNFFELMRGNRTDYFLNDNALEYLGQYKINESTRELMQNNAGTCFEDKKALQDFFALNNITGKETIRKLTESMLYATLLESDIPKDLLVLSDGAPQFAVFDHGMCWIHAERNIQKLTPKDEVERKLIDEVSNHIWKLYSDLKRYQENVTARLKEHIELEFERIFGKKTPSKKLNEALQGIYKYKNELLKVLKHPSLPLHNNSSESDIREFVIKRKVSGGTRSDKGRNARDTYTSLIKTCKKLGISFWDYLGDRITGKNELPSLPEIVKIRASSLSKQ